MKARRLSRADLTRMAASTPKNFAHPLQHLMGIAMQVLDFQFGRRWIQNNILADGRGDQYLRLEIDINYIERKWLRLIDVAEMIYNFQETAGIEQPLSRLDAGVIEATVAELRAARLLKMYGNILRFHKADEIAGGENYDLNVMHTGTWMPTEVKSKRGDTDITEKSILKSCKAASSQLPKGRPSIVLCEIPESFISDDTMGILASVANDFFRTSSRVCLLVFHVAFRAQKIDGGGAWGHAIYQYENLKPIMPSPAGSWHLTGEFDVRNWWSFQTMFRLH